MMLVLLIARNSDSNTTIIVKPNHSSQLSLVMLWECDYLENLRGLLEYAMVSLDPETTEWVWVVMSLPATAATSSQWTTSHNGRYPTVRKEPLITTSDHAEGSQEPPSIKDTSYKSPSDMEHTLESPKGSPQLRRSGRNCRPPDWITHYVPS